MDHLDERRDAADIDGHGIRPPRAYDVLDGEGAGGVAVVLLEGELDVAAVPALRARLEAAAPGTGIVLDCAGATFFDSAILKELLRARVDLTERDVRLVLAAVPYPLERLLELTGTAELFERVPDADAAITRLTG